MSMIRTLGLIALGIAAVRWAQRHAPPPAAPAWPAAGRRSTPPGPPPVRDAGRAAMRDAPRRWDRVDEAGDESFPASDPPGGY